MTLLAIISYRFNVYKDISNLMVNIIETFDPDFRQKQHHFFEQTTIQIKAFDNLKNIKGQGKTNC